MEINREYWTTDMWKASTPEIQGVDSEKLWQANDCIKAKYTNIYNFLVVKNGFLIYEQYYRGAQQSDRRDILSVNKSFISALVGIALKQGHRHDNIGFCKKISFYKNRY